MGKNSTTFRRIKEDEKMMEDLIDYFISKKMTPEDALRIMSFTSYTLQHILTVDCRIDE